MHATIKSTTRRMIQDAGGEPGISSERQYDDLVRAVAAEGREKDEEKRGAA